MTDNDAFEKLWAIKGHAQAVDLTIVLQGVDDSQLKILNDTVNRMQQLMQECLLHRNITQ